MLCQCIKCIVPRNYSTIDSDNSMEPEANSQQNTQTRLILNRLNVKGAHNKFDQHLAKSNETMQPTRGEMQTPTKR